MSDNRVTLTSRDGGIVSAYLALPSSPNGGAVVVFQEIFGINDYIKRVASEFSKAGYIAIAPDLFWRQEPGLELDPAREADVARAMALFRGLDEASAVEDGLIAADYVRERSESNGRVGAVGYCLGGKLAYLASMEEGIDAAVSYYGVGIHSALYRVREVQCKMLMHIANADVLCPPDAQAQIITAAETNSNISVMRHPGVGHAFARSGGPTYDAAAAKRANDATLQVLNAEVAQVTPA